MTNQVLYRAQCKALIQGSIFPGKNQYAVADPGFDLRGGVNIIENVEG